MSRAKIILTADDYGFCDSVDNGIIAAAEKGYISSVAAFANGPKAKDRLDRLRSVQQAIESTGGFLDIGAHLTITSGKPISDDIKKPDYGFVDKDGYFRTFNEMKFPLNGTKAFQDARFAALQAELLAQLKVYGNSGLNIMNLSSHHNSLTFTKEYYQELIKFSIAQKIPLRSHVIYPPLKEVLYQLQWRVRLQDDNHGNRIHEVREFFKNIEKQVEIWKTVPIYTPFPKMPAGINGVNYGPVIASATNNDVHVEKARKKAKRTFKEIQDEKKGGIMEFCFHLCDPEVWRIDQLVHHYEKTNDNASNPHFYPGVAPGYFEGRRMEFLSLEYLHEKIKEDTNRPEIVSWELFR